MYVFCVLFIVEFVLGYCVVVLCGFIVEIFMLEYCVVVLFCCGCEGGGRGGKRL